MKFTEELATSQLNLITSIEPGYVVVQKKKIKTSHIIAPDALTDWELTTFSEITADHLTPISQLNPEVILLGTGDKHIIPEKVLFQALVKIGIGFEIMDTAAACRTYNILVSEGRRAIVGLII